MRVTLYEAGGKKTEKPRKSARGGEKFVLNSLQDRESWYHQGRWFWPLLCSGPAVSLPSERRGFLFLSRRYNHGLDSRVLRAHVSMPSQTWFLDGGSARLEVPGVTALIESRRPRLGLTAIVVQNTEWAETRLLGVSGPALTSPPASVADWHVRGSDLLATYELASPYSASVDLCWHAEVGKEGDPWFARVDFLVSVRTDKLDWRHEICAESAISAASSQLVRQRCSCFSLNRLSYAEFVHPADLYCDEPIEPPCRPGRLVLRRRLFRAESLEKGVILRARARGLFLPAAVAPATVETCYENFIAADPPLGG